MAERAVRAALIVIDSPGFDLCLRICDRRELVDVQTLIAQPAVKGFDERVFHGFPGADEIELDAAREGPVLERPSVLERPRHELGAVIDGDRPRWRAVGEHTIQGRAHGLAGHAGIHF